MAKMTKRELYTALLGIEEVSTNETYKAMLEHELELLSKKNGKEKKPTKQQEANKGICAEIVEGMIEGERYTVTEIMKNILTSHEDLTNQRVSALLRGLIAQGSVIRTEEKGKAYFALATDEVEE